MRFIKPLYEYPALYQTVNTVAFIGGVATFIAILVKFPVVGIALIGLYLLVRQSQN